MNLNPAIVIPTFWCARRSSAAKNGEVFDYMTPVDQEGNLGRCLASLQQLAKTPRIIILVVAEHNVAGIAADKVRGIADNFPHLNTIVIGAAELGHLHRRMDQDGLGGLKPCVCLETPGAARNLGSVIASIFGHDTIIYMEDDEILISGDFIERALYGLGAKTPNGTVITAKTGYFIDENGDYTAKDETRWYLKHWNKNKDFNLYIEKAVKGARLSRANTACGGCMVMHAETYGAVAFDPWAPKGEDLDFVLSARMYNTEVWLDNQLAVRKLASARKKGVTYFTRDMRRWFYETRKLEFAKAQIDLMQIDPRSLNPYPGEWLTKKIKQRAFWTSLLSIIGSPEHGAYWSVLTKGRKEASEFAKNNCGNYFELQRQWPTLVKGLWNCTSLAVQFTNMRTSKQSSSDLSFTGRFAAVQLPTQNK